MRLKTSITILAAAAALTFGASFARAEEMNSTVDPRSASYASEVFGPQAAPAPAHPEQLAANTETEAGTPKPLRLTLKDPEERFAEAPMPIASHDVHYDDTPQGIPAHVMTMGFVQKF